MEIDIHEIKNPQILKTLSNKELKLLCAQIREEIVSACSINGGHLASNLGVVELTVALHRVFDFKNDKLLFDVGHQCYTHKILTGRSLEKLRKRNGVSGFEKRHESEYDCFEAGHSSTSLSAAYGMAVTRDINNEKYEVVAVIGDGALASGLAFEGLNNIGHGKSKVIIILNDNDMSISRPVGGFSRFLQRIRLSVSYNKKKRAYQRFMCKTRFGLWIYNFTAKLKNKFKRMFLSSNIFDTFGFAYFGPVNGHDLKALEKVLNQAKKSTRSAVIHVLTVKGKGYEYAENDTIGTWHGVPPFNIDNGEFIIKPSNISWSKLMSNLLEEEMGLNEKLVLINPAMIEGSSLRNIFTKFSNRAFDVGICESHAITMASGVALNGYHPIVSIYSTFMQRAFDEIQQDLARMELNATIFVDRAGLVGEDGETHQGIFDEAMLYTIPNTVITMPSNSFEAKCLLQESFNNHGVFAIRFPKTSINDVKEDCVISFGMWRDVKINKNDDVIVTFGPIIDEVKAKVKNVDIINALYQKPILDCNVERLLSYKRVILYNPYATNEGFINNLVKKLALYNYRGKILIVAIEQDFVKTGTVLEQMNDCHVSISQLIEAINADRGVQ